jgi:large subunit ribosomal protein L5
MIIKSLKQRYKEEVISQMKQRLNYKNVMMVPKLEKIVINMGVGEAKEDPKALEAACNQLALISGQKPIIKKARKAIAGFKIKKGTSIACMVTLRKDRMYEFLDRLINVVLPRIKDFKGLPTSSFDGRGNYTIGIKEQIAFPEIDYNKIDKIRGMNITIVTTAKTDKEAEILFRLLGLPLKE